MRLEEVERTKTATAFDVILWNQKDDSDFYYARLTIGSDVLDVYRHGLGWYDLSNHFRIADKLTGTYDIKTGEWEDADKFTHMGKFIVPLIEKKILPMASAIEDKTIGCFEEVMSRRESS
ncbi:MAG: hypothetical protein LUD47_07785 [Clostridia bacterium]|nr:hypothetical protein [Clostridia bacterium]